MRTIANLLRTRVISSQDELLQILMLQGMETTQATLSRDLRDLRAEKRSMADGTVRYVVDEEPASTPQPKLQSDLLSAAIESVSVCGPFVVVKTKAGYAGAAGREIENQAPEQVLGTISGEDTILVIPRDTITPQALKGLLQG